MTSASLRLLVVDDDEVLLRSLGRRLQQLGCAVETTAEGEEALRLLKERTFDAMILDLRMVGVDGWEVLQQIAELRPRPVTVLHSAYLDVRSTVDAIRFGAGDVVEKPADATELLVRIRNLLGNSSEKRGPDRILGETPHMRLVREQIQRVARFPDLSVLVEGETGTGKELVANAIHELTNPDAPLIAVNCAAVPAELFESELYGHEAGSFTGAKGTRVGLLEAAQNGTIFLDEVGELPLELQPKLLRVLETRSFRRVGSNRRLPLRARIVSATNRSLANDADRMRSDLYFRLAGFMVWMPPLRERMADLALLADHFVEAFVRRYPGSPTEMTPRALDALRTHDWPGNLRELRSVIEQAAVVSAGNQIGALDIGEAMRDRTTSGTWRAVTEQEAASDAARPRRPITATVPIPTGNAQLRDVEREMILDAYAANGQNLSKTARQLGIPRSTLRDKLKRYGAR